MEDKIELIVPKIFEEISTDGENESRELLSYYIHCTRRERAVINTVLLYLCGWTFPTIVQKCGIRSMKAALR
jgi:hypothetical protein